MAFAIGALGLLSAWLFTVMWYALSLLGWGLFALWVGIQSTAWAHDCPFGGPAEYCAFPSSALHPMIYPEWDNSPDDRLGPYCGSGLTFARTTGDGFPNGYPCGYSDGDAYCSARLLRPSDSTYSSSPLPAGDSCLFYGRGGVYYGPGLSVINLPVVPTAALTVRSFFVNFRSTSPYEHPVPSHGTFSYPRWEVVDCFWYDPDLDRFTSYCCCFSDPVFFGDRSDNSDSDEVITLAQMLSDFDLLHGYVSHCGCYAANPSHTTTRLLGSCAAVPDSSAPASYSCDALCADPDDGGGLGAEESCHQFYRVFFPGLALPSQSFCEAAYPRRNDPRCLPKLSPPRTTYAKTVRVTVSPPKIRVRESVDVRVGVGISQ